MHGNKMTITCPNWKNKTFKFKRSIGWKEGPFSYLLTSVSPLKRIPVFGRPRNAYNEGY